MFAGKGYAILTNPDSDYERASAVMVQPNGKIVVGVTIGVSVRTAALVQLNADGTLDSTFGVNGRAMYPQMAGSISLTRLARQPTGDIVAAAWLTATRLSMVLRRFRSDGALDPSFAIDGPDDNAVRQALPPLVVLPDGKLLLSQVTYDADARKSVPVCRFYIPPPLGDSHFYSANTTECAQTGARNPAFTLESSNAMFVRLPIRQPARVPRVRCPSIAYGTSAQTAIIVT